MPSFRLLPSAFCLAVAALLAPAITAAQSYPQRPIRMIVGLPPGGSTDIMARALQPHLEKRLGQPIVIDNRPGAGGAIGIEAGARAAADGYTFVIISGTHAATSTLQGKRAYDLVRDFAPVIWATTQPYIVNVNAQVPARTVKELIAYSKAKPNAITYGSPGAGSAQHLAAVLLASMTGAQFFHVPYKGGAQVVNDVIGGQIQMSFTNYVICRPHIESGKLRALAVTTAKRSKALPDLPAISETVPGYDADNWYGFIAPAKTPPQILDTLHREISVVLQAPQIKQRLAAEASEVVAVNRAEFGRHVDQESVKWGEVIRKAGITAQ
jgi:tripartite-type tricarboxylate transporter receptor subunit TctC